MTLAGRVGVTRPAGRGRSLAAALVACGLEAIEVPLIETRVTSDLAPLRRALGEGASLVVLSSTTSVPALVAAGGAPERSRVAAVGPATSAALAEAGLPAAVVGDGSGGAALAELIGRPATPGERAVVLAAAGGRREVVEGLAGLGWLVEEVVVYSTVPCDVSPADVVALDACDVVSFASPSAVEAFVALRDGDGRALEPRPAVAIGETTASAARAAGFDVVLADEATDEAMAQAATQAIGRAHGS